MGLDGIELLMVVEDEFKIAISDADAEKCDTVGKLFELVYSKLHCDPRDICPSQHGFYVVRKHLISLLDVERSAVKPDTELDDLISYWDRRSAWEKILTALINGKSKSFELVRPKWMKLLVLFVLPVLVSMALVIFSDGSFYSIVLSAVFAAFLGYILTIPFEREFPKDLKKVRDLVKFVTNLGIQNYSREEAFQKLRSIIVKQLGVNESKVTHEANFVKDLGLD